jgi:NAD(P)-dependent dehydrogenase (short-subunit alcohol dehydrogenase family)
MSRYPRIELEGALVAVTGAARGIGLATAKEFSDRGARVALGDLDEPLVADAATGLGPTASGHHLDVADKQSFRAFLNQAERLHTRPVDVLVNNAGIMPTGAFLEQPDHLDQLTIDINLHGVIHGMRLALPGMLERGHGHVVNVASLAGKFPLPGLAVYNASKFAVVGLTAATRLEMQNTGVSITAVLPSAVRTELASGIEIGLLPAVDPEDIAHAIIDSLRTRSGEIVVPSYLGPAAGLIALMPDRVMRLVRTIAHDDAALTRVDSAARGPYLQRIFDA